MGHIAGRSSTLTSCCHGLEIIISKEIMLLRFLRSNLHPAGVPPVKHHYTHCKSLK